MEEIKGETQERERSLRELLVLATRIAVHVDKFEDDDSMRQGVQFSDGPSSVPGPTKIAALHVKLEIK